jgi:hypothetical protein
VSWRNMFTLQKMCPISAVDSFYDSETGKFLLLIADEMGYVRIQDISSIVSEFNLDPVDVIKDNAKRNPWRVLSIDKAEMGSKALYNYRDDDQSEGEGEEVEPLLKEF